jgi:hypoxanthine-DNA glycosylase
MTQAKPLSYSFPPIVGGDPGILILGSMPGTASLKANQYYAHPRNAFWPIMAQLLGFDSNASYSERCQQLVQHGIAVWDVLKACYRPGSLDQHIDPATMTANDFNAFLAEYPKIQSIFFNGGKAEQVFLQRVKPQLVRELQLTRLPSTSPAHAAMSFKQKQQYWQRQLQSAQ